VPLLAALTIQIVGAPDEIAGEVPVAVAQGKIDDQTAREVQATVLTSMGPIYVPDEVIQLSDLGIDAYPRTMAGKIKKTELADLVRKYRNERDQSDTNGSRVLLEKEVVDIWSRAIGRDPKHIELDALISDFADSITVMRVRDKIKRQTGKSLSLAEMASAGTLAGQIKLLQQKSASQETTSRKPRPQRDGPPGIEDMVHLVENPELLDTTKELIVNAINPYGFMWEDVLDVLPVYDFASVLAETGIFNSWNFKMAVLPKTVNEQVTIPNNMLSLIVH
jgi:aryl carrier-like protein